MLHQGYVPPQEPEKEGTDAPLDASVPQEDAIAPDELRKPSRCRALLAVIGVSAVVLAFLWIPYIRALLFSGIAFSTALSAVIAYAGLPHLLLGTVAFVFALLGWMYYCDWCVLTAALLFTVAAVLIPRSIIEFIAQGVTCFVVYGLMQRDKAAAGKPAPSLVKKGDGKA